MDSYFETISLDGILRLSNYLTFERNYGHILNKINKEGMVLEFGPGGGQFIDYLVIKGFKNIYAIEPDEVGYNFLSTKFKENSSIKVVRSGINEFFEINNQKFDLIISRQVIEHFDEEYFSKFLRLSYANLGEKGLMINETINATNIMYGFYLAMTFTHKRSFTLQSYVHYLKFNTNFKIVNGLNFIYVHPLKLAYSTIFDRKLKVIVSGTNGQMKKLTGNVKTEVRKNKIKLFFQYCKMYYIEKRSRRFSEEGIFHDPGTPMTPYIIFLAEK